MFWRKKKPVTMDQIIEAVKAGLHESETAKVNKDTVTVESRGTTLLILKRYDQVVEVQVSIEAYPLLVATTLARINGLCSWRVHHFEFIHTEDNKMLWGPDAQYYAATREVLRQSMPGMVLSKENLC